jgi:hypothetical protein
MRCASSTLARFERDDDLVRVDLADAFPKDPPPSTLSGPPLDEAARADHQRHNPELVAVDLMNPAEPIAVEALYGLSAEI